MNLALRQIIYRVEDVDVDVSRGCVRRKGQELYLRPQVFQVLLYLLQRRERLVSKEELMQTLWSDAAVTDNTLVQCIADIRKTFGDDSRQPRFVKTVHKSGYRFIGPVQEREVPEQAASVPAPLPAPSKEPLPLSSRETALTNQGRRWKRLALIAAVVLVGLLLALGTERRRRVAVQAPAGKSRLAVMYFENQSRRPGLEWLRAGLADMLITGLVRSSGIEVLSRQQLHLLLERAGHKGAGSISLPMALDVARRSQADSVVLGSYAVLGEQIRIDVHLHETKGGRLIAADRLVVDRASDILTRVDLLALKLHVHLGSPPSEAPARSRVSDVMTNNLEAYRYYSLGLEKAQSFENAQAVELFEKAVSLDPQFAMAHARIGYAYAVTDFLPEKGRSHLERAFALSDRLSPKDRLYITAWYSIAQLDYPRAMQTFREIIAGYPHETEAYWRLARLLFGEDRADEAIDVIRRGLVLDAESKDFHNLLGAVLATVGRSADAIAAHQRYLVLAPQEPNAHDSLGMSYQRCGRLEDAVGEYEKALALSPDFEPAIIHLGDAYFQQGRYREAVAQYERYVRTTRTDPARALGWGSIAHVLLSKGDLARAAQATARETSLAPSASWNAVVLALKRGDRARAATLWAKVEKTQPAPARGARGSRRPLEYFEGYLALEAGRTDEAIAHFKKALSHLPPTSGIDLYEDCLARAYLDLGRWDEALAEYQRVLSLHPRYPLAQYHLGRIHEHKGDAAQARLSYEAFLKAWDHADPDVPEVVDARKRLAAL